MLAALIANPFLFKAFDLSSIRSVYVGAGSVTPELRAKVEAAQPGWNIITGYGKLQCSHPRSIFPFPFFFQLLP